MLFPTPLFSAVKPVADLFKKVCKHDVLQSLVCVLSRVDEVVFAAASTGTGALASCGLLRVKAAR